MGDFLDSRFLIDALSMTSKIHSLQGFMDLFGLANLPFETRGGHNVYRDALYYDGVCFSFNPVTPDGGICLELSGQGCRVFETFGHGDYQKMFDEYFENPDDMNITRLDVAFDDQEGILDFEQLCYDTIAKDEYGKPTDFVSKFRICEVDFGVPAATQGNTIYWGSKKSAFFFRVYDKAKERGFTDGRHWVRVELQLRKPYAVSFLKKSATLREGLLGAIREYIRYVDDSGTDSNMRRWPSKSYWEHFLDGVQSVKLFDKPGVDYNIGNLETFVYRQAGNAISALLRLTSDEEFKKRIRERGTVPNPKYERLIAQLRCNTNKIAGASEPVAAPKKM